MIQLPELFESGTSDGGLCVDCLKQPPSRLGLSGRRWVPARALGNIAEPNCGTGAGGFQEGNTCARGGGVAFRSQPRMDRTREQSDAAAALDAYRARMKAFEDRPLTLARPAEVRPAAASVADLHVPDPPKTQTQFDPGKVPTVEVPLGKIKLSQDVPNFKSEADLETGVVAGNQLAGKYERTGTAPIVLWERNNGDLEIITGRHRLDLARRTGEETIPSQIVREKDGFTQAHALTFDAEANIRDGQGDTEDYAHYFKNSPTLSQGQAESRGLLSRAKGKAGLDLGRNATDDLYTAWQNDRLNTDRAVAIARAAPGDGNLQRLGLSQALKGKSAPEVENFIKAVQHETKGSGATEMDMFGSSDAALNKAEEMASKAAKYQASINDQIRAVNSAAKRPEAAAKLGVDVKDPASVLRRVKELRGELARWASWPQHPDLVAQVRANEGGQQCGLSFISPDKTCRVGLGNFEDEIRHDKQQEHVAIWDKDGKLIDRQQGVATSVDFSDDVAKKMRGGVLSHNHPTGRTFSRGDLEVAANYGLHEMRIVTPDHTYSITIPKTVKGWDLTEDGKGPSSALDEGFKPTPGQLYNEAQWRSEEQATHNMIRNSWSFAKASEDAKEKTVENFAKEAGWKYSKTATQSKPSFTLSAPESIADQAARQSRESAAALRVKQQEEVATRAKRRLAGGLGSAAQFDMFGTPATGELFAHERLGLSGFVWRAKRWLGNARDQRQCGRCGARFAADALPECAMGAVACPQCAAPVPQRDAANTRLGVSGRAWWPKLFANKGTPCGDSFIAPDKECHKGAVAATAPAAGPAADRVQRPTVPGSGSLAAAVAHLGDSDGPETYAKAIYQTASAAERTATPDLEGAVKASGGELHGLKNRLKTEESLTRKLPAKAEKKGITVKEYAGKLGDALRYTAVLPESDYTGGVLRVKAALEAKNYKFTDKEQKWGNEDYKALHFNMVTPSGLTTELQFHTPESIATKGPSHKVFEEMRVTKDPSVIGRCKAKLRALWAGVRVPEGVFSI